MKENQTQAVAVMLSEYVQQIDIIARTYRTMCARTVIIIITIIITVLC
jgi:hypothetical protein